MKKLLCCLLALLSGVPAFALTLDKVFSSHMVLQQQKPIRFFGESAPRSRIKVNFNGKTVTVSSDAKGKWQAVFPAMKASFKPLSVKVSDGKKQIALKDILIGEVWFCSGQSNMEMPVGRTYLKGWSAFNCEKELKDSVNYPGLRLAYQAQCFSHKKELPVRYKYIQGWAVSSPASVHYYSATAYFFGRELYRQLKVPVGLIHASWGGSAITPWISRKGYEESNVQPELSRSRQFDDDAQNRIYEKKVSDRFSKQMKVWHPLFVKAGAGAKVNWHEKNYDDSKWRKARPGAAIKYVVRWNRARFKLPAGLQNKDLLLTIPRPAEQCDIYLNGKRVTGYPAWAPEKEKRIHITLKKGSFDQKGENVLAVRSEYFHGWISYYHAADLLKKTVLSSGSQTLNLKDKWKQKDQFSCTFKATGNKRVPPACVFPYAKRGFYSNMYNAMVSGWTQLPIRGVIWYQGCAGGSHPHYYILNKALIRDWRKRWNTPDMPFILVQLTGYDLRGPADWRKTDPNKPHPFAMARNNQFQMLELPHTGVATAIDLGEKTNIHPGNKQDVGRRLALEALRVAYKRKLVSQGPVFVSAVREKNTMRVKFKNVEKGLRTSDGKAPNCFAIAGADKKFVWAQAKIDGKDVIVWSSAVKTPCYVRYAYVGYCGELNLQNKEGLPAYPFRSDRFPYEKVR